MRQFKILSLKKSIIAFILVGISSFIIFRALDPYGDEIEMIKDRNRNYKRLTYDENIFGEIIHVFSDRGIPGIILDDSSKVTVRHSRNYDYKDPFINTFLQEGDQLIKRANSDTLWIKRNGQIYFFVIGEFINKKD